MIITPLPISVFFRTRPWIALPVILTTGILWFAVPRSPDSPSPVGLASTKIPINIDLDGYLLNAATTRPTVRQALAQLEIGYENTALVLPGIEHQLHANDTITIRHRFPVIIIVDGREITDFSFTVPVQQLLSRQQIVLDADDRVDAPLSSLATPNQQIRVVRVENRVEIEQQAIPFATIQKEDDTLSILEEYVEQGGIEGVKTVTSSKTYADGELESSTIVSEVIDAPAVDEVRVQGTKIIIGHTEEGYASWYRSPKGGMSAASLTFPKGTKVRVTNTANHRSAIVTINDSGPYVEGRIIDLNSQVFTALGAPLWSGTIYVTVEELL